MSFEDVVICSTLAAHRAWRKLLPRCSTMKSTAWWPGLQSQSCGHLGGTNSLEMSGSSLGIISYIYIYNYIYIFTIHICMYVMFCYVLFCYVIFCYVMLCMCACVCVYIYIYVDTFPDAYMYPGCPVFFARNHPWNHACRGQWTCTTVVLATSSWHFDDCRSIQRSCNLDQRAWVADPQSGRCSNSTHGTLPTKNLDVMSNENIYKLNI